jgi:mutator protein MutT
MVMITKRPEGSHLAGFWEFPGGKQEGHLAGFWEFPGGKQEVSETLEECLAREIKEELGLEVRAEKLLLTVDHEYEDRFISLYLFLCAQLGGEPKPLECEEMKKIIERLTMEYWSDGVVE